MLGLTKLALLALLLTQCAGSPLPSPPEPDAPLRRPARASGLAMVGALAPSLPSPVLEDANSGALASAPTEAVGSADVAEAVPNGPANAPPPTDDTPEARRCASVPPLGPDGTVPPAPPHAPLGEDLPIPNDRPTYVLPGDPGDPRVIVYLHGMCGDVTAADYFREAVRAHGTLIALRGDTPCDNGRFKWRADPARIQARVREAFEQVNAQRGGGLDFGHAVLFGYSQGADRAEKLAAHFPKQYSRIVLGGPPMKPSPIKLGHAARVAILGGELETTDNMRAGFDALQAAGVRSRFVTLECAYHGYFGTRAETQLGDVLDWVTSP